MTCTPDFCCIPSPVFPLWVGEFGTCQTLDCGANSDWFVMYIRYLKENDLGWSYWPLNGAQSTGASRKYDGIEDYGLLSPDYQHIAAPKLCSLESTFPRNGVSGTSRVDQTVTGQATVNPT
jgi:hypothetical protein